MLAQTVADTDGQTLRILKYKVCSWCRLSVAKKTPFWAIFNIWRTPVLTPFYRRGSNFMWMRSLCRLPVAKKHNFGQILTIWGLLYRPSFTSEGQIWCAIVDPRYTLTCQISSRSVYYVELCWRKSQFLRVFLDFGIQWCRHLAAVWESWTRCITTLYSQNVPLSKRPVVETSRSRNVPSQNVPPWSKRLGVISSPY